MISFVLLAVLPLLVDAGMCPKSHPYAYWTGKQYCCSVNKEKRYSPQVSCNFLETVRAVPATISTVAVLVVTVLIVTVLTVAVLTITVLIATVLTVAVLTVRALY